MLNKFIQNFSNKTSNPLNNVGLPQKQLFQKLWDYYSNNGLYEGVQAQSYSQNKWLEAFKPLRTPVNRSVEFYVSKMLSGDVTISAQSKMSQEAIEQVWKWSNFDAQKQVLSRFLALTGNLFVKVVNDESKVWFENIPPSQVTDFKTDLRGYLTEIRIDIPVTVDGKNLTHTEYWNKSEGYYAIWQHNQTEATELEQLGEPYDTGFLAELGVDFIPIIFVKFKDTGKQWGDLCVNHALDKIDNANRLETRLESLLFKNNRNYWVVSANSADKDGSPIPAPKFKNTEDDLALKEDGILYMPGVSSINT